MSTVLEQMTAFLSGKGLSAAQVAGVEGNAQIESGLRTDALNRKEGAIGLFQWENGRRTALQNFARTRGTTETDLTTQLNYLWTELTGSERAALTALLQTTTPGEAAAVFDQKFERSSGSSRALRVSAAQQIAATGSAGNSAGGGVATGDGSGGTGGTSDAFLGLPDSLNPATWAGAAVDAVTAPIEAAGKAIGRRLIDAGLILIGVLLLIAGAVLIARGTGNDLPAIPSTTPSGSGAAPAETEGSATKTGAKTATKTGTAEEAAMLA